MQLCRAPRRTPGLRNERVSNVLAEGGGKREEEDALCTMISNPSVSLTLHTALLNPSIPLRTKILGHVPPRFETVLRRVMYVPPMRGSAI